MTTTIDPRPPVAPGEPAPDFTLPAVDGDRTVSLADFRGLETARVESFD